MRGALGPAGARAAALVAVLVFAVAAVLLPWFALDGYVASGWQATWLARAALVLAAVAAMVLRAAPGGARAAALCAGLATVLVAVRAAFPPDFGFDFDGLEVPTERRPGLWVALGAIALATAAAASARPESPAVAAADA